MELRAEDIDADDVAIVGGAIDGIGRVLQAHLGPGDRVAVEDPTFPPLFDLLGALGLVPEPVGSDRDGPLPGTLETVLGRGAEAVVLTSRAQNPTGASVSPERSRELRRVLQRHADVLVIEDDTGGLATEDQLASVIDTSRPRWAFVRSFSMVFGPDLRTAIIAADEVTLARVEGRQWVSGGWVSHILQRLAWRLLTDGATMNRVRKARSTYGIRRQGLVDALAECGIEVSSRSGFNVWVPVAQESATISSLQAAGWGVAAGEPFRLESPAGIRVTASRLTRGDSKAFAAALADSFQRRGRTYGG
jgi:DNA-binding transcriptional MocR family regulator